MEAQETPHNSTDGSGRCGLAVLAAGISRIQNEGLEALSNDDLRALVVGFEREARRVRSVQIELLSEIDRRGLHSVDGHASAKVMVRHVCQLSPAEAARRAKVARALRDLPILATAHRRGELGADQMDLMARVYANPRVSDAFVAFQDDALLLARSCSYPDFELVVRRWERLADADGPEPRNDANHRNRNVRLRQDSFDLAWHLHGSFAALQGSSMSTVLRHFAQLEWEKDWAEARSQHGDAATIEDLPRTDAQRLADALEHICNRAAAAPPQSCDPEVIHNIVWDADTYFATLHRIACNDRDCDAPGHGAPNRWYDPASYRCQTIDGVELEPVEAALSSLGAHVRRVLVDARSVTIDLGRKARLFTGASRLAVQLHGTHCMWPGCRVPTTACEADHIKPHARGGPTRPANGAPLCGRHNRWKQKGYTTWRDPSGRWHVSRPDGAEIT